VEAEEVIDRLKAFREMPLAWRRTKFFVSTKLGFVVAERHWILARHEVSGTHGGDLRVLKGRWNRLSSFVPPGRKSLIIPYQPRRSWLISCGLSGRGTGNLCSHICFPVKTPI
jgi:hypothetical protein